MGPEELVKPLLALAKEGVDGGCDEYVLAIHDWSRVNYGGHESKKDRLQMTHKSDVGYELQSSVLVVDREGDSVGHLRQWQAQGRRWWARVKGGSKVRWGQRTHAVEAVAQALRFEKKCELEVRGKPATQWLAQTDVTLTRAAKPKQVDATGSSRAQVNS
ncbi:MAG: hypothetical protein RLZZ612_310 [Pseudomonadota bacterium]